MQAENSVGTVIIPFQRPMSVLLKLIFMRKKKTGTYSRPVQREAGTLMECAALNNFFTVNNNDNILSFLCKTHTV